MKCCKSYKRIHIVHFGLFDFSKTQTSPCGTQHAIRFSCLLSRQKPMILSEVGHAMELIFCFKRQFPKNASNSIKNP